MPVARILLCQFSRLPCFKPRWGHALGTQKSELIPLRATDDRRQTTERERYSCCPYAHAYVVPCWLFLKLCLHVLRLRRNFHRTSFSFSFIHSRDANRELPIKLCLLLL
ncbi:hypothetical protein H112_05417 [Trichophyton rubrum D6]|uniref:Uncharacterized protein n=2 Tax=Trichophyton TaxID=5550 RepID=A0A022VZN3_TRIRU|nr:hypothetical protein H100_05436 [Trichophyton rubrum MR850]EZF40649.1 hypothetical protein H102_05399 [Trichophyton rubrum CBS 100081]EZF51208.1 hypothetical protein H103_05429 [Trichophyton rubrum CBS 288.86]EZF61868.1 hypothetical protein H104_05416 [Trichophyton rubrum CBS 289.86]EZF72556.1 hypothetical protein H105_05443 [Trichophyton soudanense CBS 452.61]EZF83189.1 hypothetical protein H110_05423 [Trichophyton rubrum MR1448]EZF93803.1 hypothetical protein H113_05469 [Trichophyton rub